jgi:RNA polymerase sigma-70 factor (ECF subfamily)
MDKASDAELVERVLFENDLDSFARLVERYHKRVYALCYSIVSDWAEAQDLAQETFVKAWIDLRKLREPAKFGPWLRRVTFGTAMDWLKGFKPELYRSMAQAADLDGFEAALASDDATPSQAVENIELAEQLNRAIASLPVKYRVPFVLFQVDGLSHGRVAEFLEMKPNTVMSRVHRAREILKEQLAIHYKEFPMTSNVMNTPPLPDDFSRKVIRLTSVTIELGVADAGRSMNFYVDALGFKCGIRHEENGKLDWVSVSSGAIKLFLHHALPDAESPEARLARRSVKLFFRPDDGLSLHASLKAKGYEVSEPKVASYGDREFEMLDPDGYAIIFQESVR